MHVTSKANFIKFDSVVSDEMSFEKLWTMHGRRTDGRQAAIDPTAIMSSTCSGELRKKAHKNANRPIVISSLQW